MTRFLRFSFCLLLLAAGCTSQRPLQPDERQPKPPDRIADLLYLAEQAVTENRLTTPEEDNAYLHYLSVLAIEPGHPQAIEGINGLIETYLAWALDVADEGRYQRARQYVARARAIDGDHPNIEPVQKRINEQQNRIKISYDLNREAVRQRLPESLPFDTIARQIERRNAFVTIRAPDDPSGRWIYQQLNERVSFRIEARFVAETFPSVELSH